MPPKAKRAAPAAKKSASGRNLTKKQREELRDLAADYGWAYSVLEEFPQLMQVFRQAVDNNWAPQKFVAEIQDTPWFKRHSDTWRQNTYLRLTDPKTYDQRVRQKARELQDMAGSLGIEFKSQKQLREMAEQSFLFGWDQTKVNNRLARMVNIMGEQTVGGSLADAQDRLNSFALANGVTVGQPVMQKWLRQIVRGSSTVQEFENYITKQAAAKFPNWARELEAGMTVAELAEPYRQTMAQMLELNPNDIRLDDRTLRRAMTYRGDDGQYQSMTVSDFEDTLRKDARWQYTNQAREQAMGVTAGLLRDWGVIA